MSKLLFVNIRSILWYALLSY